MSNFNEAKPPKFLYHYTNVSDLEKILRSRIFHSKHILNQSDKSELMDYIELFKKQIEEKAKDSEVKNILNSCLQNIESYIDKNDTLSYEYPVNIISFSEAEDDEYQWTYYGYKDDGCRISIKTENLEKKCELENPKCPCIEFKEKSTTDSLFKEEIELLKCIYDENEKEKCISCIISKLLIGNLTKVDLKIKATQLFYKNAASFKKIDFEKEQEWRLVFSHKDEICCCKRIPPFYKVKINFSDCLNDIKISSKANFPREKERLENLLKELNFKNVKITQSTRVLDDKIM